jgi:hypothetical protein
MVMVMGSIVNIIGEGDLYDHFNGHENLHF